MSVFSKLLYAKSIESDAQYPPLPLSYPPNKIKAPKGNLNGEEAGVCPQNCHLKYHYPRDLNSCRKQWSKVAEDQSRRLL